MILDLRLDMLKICPKCNKEFDASYSKVVCCSKRCAQLGKGASWRKGKTFEELYGVEKAKELREGIHQRLLGKRYALGYKHTKEFSKEMSKRLLGNTISKGRKLSEEHKDKIKLSASLNPDYGGRGKKRSSEYVAVMKIRQREYYKNHKSPMFGKTHHFETIEKQSIVKRGALNPAWNGGTAGYGYDVNFNKQFKKSIRERDGCCMVCNISIDDLKLLKRKIAIHHINYDRQVTIKENCVTLCNNHHSMTNVNRQYWTKFFYDMLHDRYGHNYVDNKIVLNVDG